MSLATLVGIERVEIVGLKSTDAREVLGPHTLVTGEVGSGKSRIADALRFAALGYVPQQGKREQDTARLMRGSLIRVTVHLSDGRHFCRSLVRKGTSFKSEATASWMDVDAKPSEVSEAIRGLFGASDLEAEECLDLRALLAASPNERARRIEALLDATAMSAADQVRLLYALPVFRLAGMDLARVPGAPAEAEQVATSLAQTLTGAQRDALASAHATAKQTLEARGAAEALTEAGRLKNQERERVRGKTQARKEVEDRMGPAPSVTLDELRERRQAATDRMAQLRAQVEAHGATSQARQAAEDAARTAQERLDAITAAGDPTERAAALRAQADALRAQALALVEPTQVQAPPPAEEDAALIEQALQLEEDARGLDAEAAKHEASAPIAPRLAPVPAVDSAHVALAEQALARAQANPWNDVRLGAGTVRALKVPAEETQVRDAVAESLEGLAARHGGTTVEEARRLLEVEQGRLAAARDEVAKVEADNAMAQAAYAEARSAWEAAQHQARVFRTDAAGLRGRAEEIRKGDRARVAKRNAEQQAAYRRACADRAAAADAMAQERRRLTQAADAAHKAAADLLQDWTARAAAVAETRARVDGIAVAAPIDLDGAERETSQLRRTVEGIDHTRAEVEAAHARSRELSALALELTTAQAAAEAWAAVEWALQRIRERDLASRGGPLVERMDRFLAAAGRTERAFLRASKGRVDFGWRRGSDEIPIEALSGGETVLATTALAGAILALRAPEVRLLLVEAAELGLHHATSLMGGCDALSPEIGTSLVATCLPIEPREGWTHIEVSAAQPATAEAAA